MSEPTPSPAIPVGILVSISDSSRKRGPRLRTPKPPGPPRVPLRHVAIMFGAFAAFTLLACAVLAVAAAPPVATTPQVSSPALAATPAALPAAAATAEAEPVLVELTLEPEREAPREKLRVLPRYPETPAEPPAEVLPAKPKVCATKLGTQINFIADPPEAFRLAREQKKLVFMIHLSGNFEDTEFT
jgi:hypothetical protein